MIEMNDKKVNLNNIDIDIEEICDANDLFMNTGGKEERLFWAWSGPVD
jgi:hypothetical protein